MAKSMDVNVTNTDGQKVLEELYRWIDELDGTMVDSITEEILETVIDIIYDNSECGISYEHI